MRRLMMDYNHWAAIAVLGEILPWADNRVELADEKDRFGLRVAKVTFGLHDNDQRLIDFAKTKVMEVMSAAGAGRSCRRSAMRTSSAPPGWATTHASQSSTGCAGRTMSRTCSCATGP